ncbi:MAG: hypothetical protein EAZ34_00980, partial [Polaromonas sp.]
MSDADNSANSSSSAFAGFGKFVPGFDFLQNLATQAAGSAAQKMPQMPGLGNWVAPTLNVEELDRRIDELKAVQFWLDQNATALKATIQALEVQKMTLATLKGMNFNMGDVANAFKLKVADSVAGGVQRVADKARTFSGLEVPASNSQAAAADAPDPDTPAPAQTQATHASSAKAQAAGGVVDPMQWWGALTQQFQTIANDAMKEVAKKAALDTTKNMATNLAKGAVKSAVKSTVRNTVKNATGMASSARQKVAGGARAAFDTARRSSQGWPTPAAGKAPAVKKPAAKTAVAKKAAPKSTSQST